MLTLNAYPRISKIILLALVSFACVTVNVNFPESAIQKASDDYVKELYRAKEKGTKPATPGKPSAFLENFSIPSAYADGDGATFTFRADTPKALEIQKRLKARVADVILQKKAGVLGETNDGKLVVKDGSKLKALLKGKVDQLVSDENEDRSDLYGEITSSNSLPSSRKKSVEQSFARSFQNESPAGTWIQDADGAWTQKK